MPRPPNRTRIGPRPEWHERARCGESNDPLFFPDSERLELQNIPQVERLYCGKCPVKANCLGSALVNGDTGIFAATTSQQRRALIRVRDRARCPLCGGTEQVEAGVHDICTACGASWRSQRVDLGAIEGRGERKW